MSTDRILIDPEHIANALQHRYDPDDWCAGRLAELRAQGEKPRVKVEWRVDKEEKTTEFRVLIIREDGRVESHE